MDLIWPFRDKVPQQYRRVDEGFDMQTNVGADVLAILPGTVHYAHDPGTDGGHFGASYPWVLLDEPYNGHIAVYYGHTYPFAAEGSHVNQGDVVSHTGAPGNGGAPDGWLEIGWWRNGPEGRGGDWTSAGQDMHDHLINAPVFQGDDMFDQKDRDTLDNLQVVLGRIESYLANVLKPELDQAHDAVAREDVELHDTVVPDVEAIRKHDGA